MYRHKRFELFISLLLLLPLRLGSLDAVLVCFVIASQCAEETSESDYIFFFAFLALARISS